MFIEEKKKKREKKREKEGEGRRKEKRVREIAEVFSVCVPIYSIIGWE
jgi:hypothetical protein